MPISTVIGTHARVGVLIMGCGWAAQIHARVLRRIPGVDLFFASRSRARAEEYRELFGGVAAFDSYEDAVAHPRIDLAVVATPTASHRELAQLALRTGRHVVVEKPAFLTTREADAVALRADQVGRRVFVAENYYYKPIARLLRRMIAGGELGDVRFVSINATKQQRMGGWRDDPVLSGGGALFEAGVHWISFAANLGMEVEGVGGWETGVGASGKDLSSLVVLRYANGAACTIAHSWELKGALAGMRLSKVQGTRGSVTFESHGMAYVARGRRWSMGVPALSDPLGYRAMWSDFIAALRENRDAEFGLARGRRDLALLETFAGRDRPLPASAAIAGPASRIPLRSARVN